MKEYFEKDILTNQFHSRFAKSKSKGIDKISSGIYADRIDSEIELIHRKINETTYSFSLYLEKLIIKNRFKTPRILSIPTIRDRIVLNQLKEYLHTEVPGAVNRTQAQKCIKDLIREIKSKKYNFFIRTDLTCFFDKIDRNILSTKLIELGVLNYPLELIKLAIDNTTVPQSYSKTNLAKYYRKHGVPQGLAISNFLAQVYLLKFDEEMDKENCFVVRFVDDMLILCKEDDSEHLLTTIKKKLKTLNLEMNENKTYSNKIAKPFEFLGYNFINNDVTIAEKNIQKRINVIAAKFRWFKNGWLDQKNRPVYLKNKDDKYKQRFIDQLNNQIAGLIFKGKKRSFLDYFREINDLSILYKLDKIVTRFFNQSEAFTSKPLNVKSFVKAYFEVKYNRETEYLFDLDKVNDIKGKRNHLIEVGYLYKYKKYTNEEIEQIYENYSQQQIKDNINFSYSNS